MHFWSIFASECILCNPSLLMIHDIPHFISDSPQSPMWSTNPQNRFLRLLIIGTEHFAAFWLVHKNSNFLSQRQLLFMAFLEEVACKHPFAGVTHNPHAMPLPKWFQATPVQAPFTGVCMQLPCNTLLQDCMQATTTWGFMQTSCSPHSVGPHVTPMQTPPTGSIMKPTWKSPSKRGYVQPQCKHHSKGFACNPT